MSQYSGNKTSFKPRYAVNGETKTPVNVVSTSMEINGQMVEGYQSTYENGTSKWTPHVLTDSGRLLDSHGVDNSTFTGSYDESTKEWKWEPTSDANVEKLAKHHKGGDDGKGRITTDQIEDKFYSRDTTNGPTEQQKLSETQTKALIQEKGGVENLEKDAKFGALPGLKEGEDRTQTSANGESQTDFEASGQLTTAEGQSIIKSTQTRTRYGNYYYPYDIKSNKQDRIIFKMKQSTGQVIDPTADIEAGQKAVGTRTSKRKATIIEGSVTLPITSGIKDSNMVDWGKATMNPVQAFAAKATMNVTAAAQEGESISDAAGGMMKKATDAIKDEDVQKAVALMIAGKAAQTQNLLSRASGAVANPNMELLFNGPGLRAFDFTFQMSPRDAHEAGQVRSIINFFKQGMSVKTTSTNIFLKAPNYFEIDYVTFNNAGQMMKHPSISIIKTCALLTCSVDYTPNNSYMTYSDESRSMVSYTMNLQFGELDPIYESDYYTELGMQGNVAGGGSDADKQALADAPSEFIGY